MWERPREPTEFSRGHSGSQATLRASAWVLGLSESRLTSFKLASIGCQQPVCLFSQRAEGRWSGSLVEDCMFAVVNISFRSLTCLTTLLSEVESKVKFLDQEFQGNALLLPDAVQGTLGTSP